MGRVCEVAGSLPGGKDSPGASGPNTLLAGAEHRAQKVEEPARVTQHAGGRGAAGILSLSFSDHIALHL